MSDLCAPKQPRTNAETARLVVFGGGGGRSGEFERAAKSSLSHSGLNLLFVNCVSENLIQL